MANLGYVQLGFALRSAKFNPGKQGLEPHLRYTHYMVKIDTGTRKGQVDEHIKNHTFGGPGR